MISHRSYSPHHRQPGRGYLRIISCVIVLCFLYVGCVRVASVSISIETSSMSKEALVRDAEDLLVNCGFVLRSDREMHDLRYKQAFDHGHHKLLHAVIFDETKNEIRIYMIESSEKSKWPMPKFSPSARTIIIRVIQDAELRFGKSNVRIKKVGL